MGLENIARGQALAPHTTFRIGGPAEYFWRVHSRAELIQAAQWGRAQALEIFILGNGSNILVCDAGVRGLVIENHADAIEMAPDEKGETLRVTAESGAPLPGLANRLARQGWRGLEWAVGIPGAVGAAIVTNAGAHGGAIGDCVIRAEILDAQNEIRWWARAELQYEYRNSFLKRHPHQYIVLRAEFELARADAADCIARMNQYAAQRRKTQPTDASVGSMFKNPPGDYAGRLIEAAGFKGMRVGNVQVSNVHANFFVNRGGATANDVLELIEIVKKGVREKFKVDLELEIELVGW